MVAYRKLFDDADRQQAFADALTGRAMQSRAPVAQGRIVPKMGIGEGLTQLAEAYLARRTGKKAGATREQAEAAKREAMAEALGGMGPQYQDAQNALDSGVHPALVQQHMTPVKPEMTDDIIEYERARQQGYQGTFEQWQTKNPSGTTVNLKNEGSIPAGYRAERDADGNIVQLVPIPGGPAAADVQATAEADALRADSKSRKADIVVDEIERAFDTFETESLPETGALGQVLRHVPGTDAHALAGFLKTIQANIGFDRLQQMREESPTGGALGAINRSELQFLQSVQGDLEQSQRKEDLQYNLARLKNAYLDVVHGEGNGPQRMDLAKFRPRQDRGAPAGVDPELWAVMSPEERALWN